MSLRFDDGSSVFEPFPITLKYFFSQFSDQSLKNFQAHILQIPNWLSNECIQYGAMVVKPLTGEKDLDSWSWVVYSALCILSWLLTLLFPA